MAIERSLVGKAYFEQYITTTREKTGAGSDEEVVDLVAESILERSFDGLGIMQMIASAMESAYATDRRQRDFGRLLIGKINTFFNKNPLIVRYTVPWPMPEGVDGESFRTELEEANSRIKAVFDEEGRRYRTRRILDEKGGFFIQRIMTEIHDHPIKTEAPDYLFAESGANKIVSKGRIDTQADLYADLMEIVDFPQKATGKTLHHINAPARIYRKVLEANEFRVQGIPNLLTEEYGGTTFARIAASVPGEDTYQNILRYVASGPRGSVLNLRFAEGAFFVYPIMSVEADELSAEETKFAQLAVGFIRWVSANVLRPVYDQTGLNPDFDRQFHQVLQSFDPEALRQVVISMFLSLTEDVHQKHWNTAKGSLVLPKPDNPLVDQILDYIPPAVKTEVLQTRKFSVFDSYLERYLLSQKDTIIANLTERFKEDDFISALTTLFEQTIGERQPEAKLAERRVIERISPKLADDLMDLFFEAE